MIVRFDFHGGGFVLDGACSSSALAVATAASQLAAHDVDLALAGIHTQTQRTPHIHTHDRICTNAFIEN